jgi:hypothetical protein
MNNMEDLPIDANNDVNDVERTMATATAEIAFLFHLGAAANAEQGA